MDWDDEDKWFARQWHGNGGVGGRNPMADEDGMIHFAVG